MSGSQKQPRQAAPNRPNFVDRHEWKGAGGVRKFMVPKKRAIDEERRAIDFVVSDATRDRDGDIIRPDGWNLDRFHENPVVLWAHDGSKFPVARAENTRVENGELVSTAIFAGMDQLSPDAEMAFRYYKDGFLNAVSAGFNPTKFKFFEDDDGPGYEFEKCELWEFSAVPIPSNPNALVQMKAAGLSLGPLVNMISAELDTDIDGMERSYRDALSKTYFEVEGHLHQAMAPWAMRKNDAARLTKQGEDVFDPAAIDEKAAAGDSFQTEGDEDHQHEFEMGEAQTGEAGEPPHVHAVNYDDETGAAIIGETDGHTHDAPAAAMAEREDEEMSEQTLIDEIAERQAKLARIRAKTALESSDWLKGLAEASAVKFGPLDGMTRGDLIACLGAAKAAEDAAMDDEEEEDEEAAKAAAEDGDDEDGDEGEFPFNDVPPEKMAEAISLVALECVREIVPDALKSALRDATGAAA